MYEWSVVGAQWAVVGFLLLAAAAIGEGAQDVASLLPVPSGAELATAEAEVQEVFGAELAAVSRQRAASSRQRAAGGGQRVAIARRMIDTAEGSRPAARYALLVRAKDLAIAAKDKAVGVEAAEGLAGFAGPADASEGHRLWSAAKKEDLAGKLAAAEVYLRALPGLQKTGFERTAVEKRLRELGWRVGPIDFNFDGSMEGWGAINDVTDFRSDASRLVGVIIGPDPHVGRRGMEVTGDACPLIEVQMSTESGYRAEFYWTTKHSPRGGQDKRAVFELQSDGDPHVYTIKLSTHRLWAGETITSIRIDPGSGEFATKAGSRFTIDYVRGRR